MSERRAKALRRAIYGDAVRLPRTYGGELHRVPAGAENVVNRLTLHCTGPRADYQRAKKAF
jgi:hypothetical protein